MIRGLHGLLYSSDPDATRRFFRDKLKLPGSDVGDGWWIFDFAEGDLGVHPIEKPDEAGRHDVSIYCDEIEKVVRELKRRGVRFKAPIADHGYGLVTYVEAPGGVVVQLYEPRYVKGGAKPARTQKSAKKPARKTVGKAAKKKPAARRT